MAERILVCVAWPYANGSLHLGHVAGAVLPADIFARYHRLMGNDVAMVSGTDQHGTPITLKAELEGITPQQVVDKYHREFLDCWERLHIGFDLFTTTGTANHAEVVRDIFLTLYKKGYIYKNTMLLPYCTTCGRFLADRYLKGTCPHCGNTDARGDQCDKCGRTLDPKELIGLTCRKSGDAPQFRESEHFFLKLSAFEVPLLKWVSEQRHWKSNVYNFSKAFLEGGLKDRAISRDIEWGVPVPLEGYDKKRIYVWLEAVIGYLSATREWAQRQNQPERWRDFWQGDCRAYYFMGKDNIPFHTIIWPAMLMGYGGLNLPYDVPANEFLTLEGRQFSTSRNWAVWLPDYLERYDPDPLRYCLTANMPETSDSDFSWKEYVRRNNDELVATYGNLVHRVLSLTYRHYGGKVPQPGALDEADQRILARAGEALSEVGRNMGLCRFRTGLTAAMALAQETNRYLDTKAPWKTVQKDKAVAATPLWVAMSVINCLKTAFYPYLPITSEKVHRMLGLEGSVTKEGWRWDPKGMVPGRPIAAPEPLFTKLDDEVAEREIQKMASSLPSR